MRMLTVLLGLIGLLPTGAAFATGAALMGASMHFGCWRDVGHMSMSPADADNWRAHAPSMIAGNAAWRLQADLLRPATQRWTDPFLTTALSAKSIVAKDGCPPINAVTRGAANVREGDYMMMPYTHGCGIVHRKFGEQFDPAGPSFRVMVGLDSEEYWQLLKERLKNVPREGAVEDDVKSKQTILEHGWQLNLWGNG